MQIENEDELLEGAKKIQRITYGNSSGAHNYAFKRIIKYTRVDFTRRAKLLDGINYILSSGDEFPNSDDHKDMLSVFENGSPDCTIVNHALTFKYPSLDYIAEELREILNRFGNLFINDKKISVTMGPYTIENIEFGKFKIDYYYVDTCSFNPGNYPPKVLALEPNCVEGHSENPHPHVSGDSICLGVGETASIKAVMQGRLYDYFNIVDAVLKTLGEGPHLSILAWSGKRCRDCGYYYEDEKGKICIKCQNEFCENCAFTCCIDEEKRCGGCWQYRCEYCSEFVCSECLEICEICNATLCKSHYQNKEHFLCKGKTTDEI